MRCPVCSSDMQNDNTCKPCGYRHISFNTSVIDTESNIDRHEVERILNEEWENALKLQDDLKLKILINLSGGINNLFTDYLDWVMNLCETKDVDDYDLVEATSIFQQAIREELDKEMDKALGLI